MFKALKSTPGVRTIQKENKPDSQCDECGGKPRRTWSQERC